ncbi:hypothetical protein DFH07DRAFT_504935 [Mycena maculata]|uniref:Uncharacterized protein n=1 Tax=Mycena maculata TaxID=230809 RepID=A0AAD7NBW5_9AGAR|nr:hypothetical protein DFH07DRAFT_504935 [Mycena maculata]
MAYFLFTFSISFGSASHQSFYHFEHSSHSVDLTLEPWLLERDLVEATELSRLRAAHTTSRRIDSAIENRADGQAGESRGHRPGQCKRVERSHDGAPANT